MSQIHPIPTDEPKKLVLHPVKTASFIFIALAALVVGRISSNRIPPPSPQTTPNDVLGEQTRTLESYLPGEVKYAATMAAKIKTDVSDPHIILDTGKELAASAASEFSKQAEKIASDSAQSVTSFIYENTIERIINNLIQSLPSDRQDKYKAPPPSSPSPTP